MLTVPPKFTAYQGFDALFHSVESYISKFANLASDMYALTAIEHIARNLPRAVANATIMSHPCSRAAAAPAMTVDFKGFASIRSNTTLSTPASRSCSSVAAR